MGAGSNASSSNMNYAADDILLSYFGRINYDFKGKYMLSATMRGDGSSKFSKGQKWGYFPSVAASWRLSDEWGMKDLRWLDNLKLRYSFGTAGNNNIPTGMGGLTQLYEVGGQQLHLRRSDLLDAQRQRRQREFHGQCQPDVGDHLFA